MSIVDAILASELSSSSQPFGTGYTEMPASKATFASSGWGSKNGIILQKVSTTQQSLLDFDGNVLVATISATDQDDNGFVDPVYLTDDIIVVKNYSKTNWILNFYKISTGATTSYTVPTALTSVTATHGIWYANGKIFCAGHLGTSPWMRLVTLDFNESTMACTNPSALITPVLFNSADYIQAIAGNGTNYYILDYNAGNSAKIFEVPIASLSAFWTTQTGNYTRVIDINTVIGVSMFPAGSSSGAVVSGALMYVEGNNLVYRSSKTPVVIDLTSWTIKSYGAKGYPTGLNIGSTFYPWEKITIGGKVLNYTVEYDSALSYSSSGTAAYYNGVGYFYIYAVKANGQPVSRKYKIPNSENYVYSRNPNMLKLGLGSDGRYKLTYAGWATSTQNSSSNNIPYQETIDVHNIIMEMSAV